MNYGSRVKANIAGLPKDYQQMSFGRQMDYNGIIKDFKATAKTGWLGTKRKSVAAALAEFKKLYGVKEYYFVDTTAPGYKDDSIQIWYKTAAQSNPAKPPITRQWKPVLIRTNAAGQVQITEQAAPVKVRAVSKQVRNPTPAAELVRIGKNGSGAENQFTQALVNLGYARRRGGRVYLTDKGKQEYKQQAGRMANPRAKKSTGRRNPTYLETAYARMEKSGKVRIGPNDYGEDYGRKVAKTIANKTGKAVYLQHRRVSGTTPTGKTQYTWHSFATVYPS